MAASVTKKAFAPTMLTASLATLYTAPANTRVSLKKVTVVNNDSVTRLVTGHLIPSGGASSTTNIITISASVAANESRDLYEIMGHSLDAGDFLQLKADSASVVTVHGTVVVTGV